MSEDIKPNMSKYDRWAPNDSNPNPNQGEQASRPLAELLNGSNNQYREAELVPTQLLRRELDDHLIDGFVFTNRPGGPVDILRVENSQGKSLDITTIKTLLAQGAILTLEPVVGRADSNNGLDAIYKATIS